MRKSSADRLERLGWIPLDEVLEEFSSMSPEGYPASRWLDDDEVWDAVQQDAVRALPASELRDAGAMGVWTSPLGEKILRQRLTAHEDGTECRKIISWGIAHEGRRKGM